MMFRDRASQTSANQPCPRFADKRQRCSLGGFALWILHEI